MGAGSGVSQWDVTLFYSCSAAVCVRKGQYISSQRLRYATGSRPEGPFKDQGEVFASDEFRIDPHPFRDPRDGRWYLFFASNIFDERPAPVYRWCRWGDDMKPLRPGHDGAAAFRRLARLSS
jgi:hypothetical protein